MSKVLDREPTSRTGEWSDARVDTWSLKGGLQAAAALDATVL